MVSVTRLRPGDVFEQDDQPFLVLAYTHTVLGRKKARVKLKVRQLKTGAVLTKTFLSEKKVEPVEVEKRKLSFLYFNGREYYFKDLESEEEFEVEKELIGGKGKFLQKNNQVEVLFWQEKPLSIELPITVDFKVEETDPGIKGNTSTNVYKPAKLENGLKIKVPLFVKVGDIIKVDTRTGEYIERV